MSPAEDIPTRGLLDTSVFIARENGRKLDELPAVAVLSVITIAELYLGVLMADEAGIRAQRLKTLTMIQHIFDPLPIDTEVARTFAELTAELKWQRRRLKIRDAWIAATAITHNLSLYTQDTDFLSRDFARFKCEMRLVAWQAGSPCGGGGCSV
jgi:predicted nucleic acid-binding protein